MINGHSSLREFGRFRLDVERKYLLADQRPVHLPLKALELLCVLVERRGAVVTKDEIWNEVWPDAFVEETNLTHNIYLLRKAFKEIGESQLIETVPRRGYRFAGEVAEIPDGEVILERHALTRTLIEIEDKRSERTIATDRSGLHISHRVAAALVAVVAIAAAAFMAKGYLGGDPASRPIRSMAVLPFRNIGPQTVSEHQGIAIADVLITRLSRLNGIDIRPTRAVAKFEDSQTASVEAGRELQTDAVLDGSVYSSEKNVRVTARLLRVADGTVIWAGEFEKLPDEMLKLQSDLALQIASSLSINRSSSVQKPFTDNPDAFELYTRGRYEWNKRSVAGMIEAEKLFRAAIDKDPDFALAYVGLADRLAMRADFIEASMAIDRALSLDPDSAEAHATRGFIDIFYRWDWREAEKELGRSIELNPGYGSAHQWLGILFEIQGRNADAISELRRAIEIDPSSPNFEADLGQAYYFDRRYDEARVHCRAALDLDPEFIFAHAYLEYIGMITRDYDAAIDEWKALSGLADNYPTQSDSQKQQNSQRLEALAASFKNSPSEFFNAQIVPNTLTPDACYGNARVYALRGDKESAFSNLACTVRSKSFSVVFVKADPIFDALRDDPRFLDIVKKMNLPA